MLIIKSNLPAFLQFAIAFTGAEIEIQIDPGETSAGVGVEIKTGRGIAVRERAAGVEKGREVGVEVVTNTGKRMDLPTTRERADQLKGNAVFLLSGNYIFVLKAKSLEMRFIILHALPFPLGPFS